MLEGVDCSRCGGVKGENPAGGGGVSGSNLCPDCRAEDLIDSTVLKRRQAEVYTLLECGYDDRQIAETMDISESTVATHRGDMRKAIRDARRTLERIEEGKLTV